MMEGSHLRPPYRCMLSNVRASRQHPGWTLGVKHEPLPAIRRFKQFNPRRRAQRERRAPLRPRRASSTTLFLDQRPPVLLRLLRDRATITGGGAARQEAPLAAKLADRSRASACSTSAPAGAASACYLAEALRRRGHGRYALEPGAARSLHRARARARAFSDERRFLAGGLPRSLQERFDRIVSVGMFEHVGVNHYPTYFRSSARSLLTEDGVALLHSIGRSDAPGCDQLLASRKYIFPGGYIPRAIGDAAGDREAGPHASPTSRSCGCTTPRRCKAWRRRFLAHRDEAKAHL